MTHVHLSQVPKDAELHHGPLGGVFFYRSGNKVYITAHHPVRSKAATRRGAFQRFIENQANVA